MEVAADAQGEQSSGLMNGYQPSLRGATDQGLPDQDRCASELTKGMHARPHKDALVRISFSVMELQLLKVVSVGEWRRAEPCEHQQQRVRSYQWAGAHQWDAAHEWACRHGLRGCQA